MKTYELCGKAYPIEGSVRLTNEKGNPTYKTMPLVDVGWTQDYEWQLCCLKSRIENPEYYLKIENTMDVMQDLKTWLLKRTTKELCLKFNKKYKCCYNFIFDKVAT